jgi:hypothetical protein
MLPLKIVWDFLNARKKWWLPPILLVALVWFGLAVVQLWPETWWPYENKFVYPQALGPSPAGHRGMELTILLFGQEGADPDRVL